MAMAGGNLPQEVGQDQLTDGFAKSGSKNWVPRRLNWDVGCSQILIHTGQKVEDLEISAIQKRDRAQSRGQMLKVNQAKLHQERQTTFNKPWEDRPRPSHSY